jgi:hypothetical protein
VAHSSTRIFRSVDERRSFLLREGAALYHVDVSHEWPRLRDIRNDAHDQQLQWHANAMANDLWRWFAGCGEIMVVVTAEGSTSGAKFGELPSLSVEAAEGGLARLPKVKRLMQLLRAVLEQKAHAQAQAQELAAAAAAAAAAEAAGAAAAGAGELAVPSPAVVLATFIIKLSVDEADGDAMAVGAFGGKTSGGDIDVSLHRGDGSFTHSSALMLIESELFKCAHCCCWCPSAHPFTH